jgi:hypothetical protein
MATIKQHEVNGIVWARVRFKVYWSGETKQKAAEAARQAGMATIARMAKLKAGYRIDFTDSPHSMMISTTEPWTFSHVDPDPWFSNGHFFGLQELEELARDLESKWKPSTDTGRLVLALVEKAKASEVADKIIRSGADPF